MILLFHAYVCQLRLQSRFFCVYVCTDRVISLRKVLNTGYINFIMIIVKHNAGKYSSEGSIGTGITDAEVSLNINK